MSKHIVIDAREYSSSSGRYVRNLIRNLESIDNHNHYTILISAKDELVYSPSNPNFIKKLVNFPKFSLSEQFAFRSFLRQLRPDLVHFAFAQQPIFYRKLKITTIHDLTPLSFNLGIGPLGKIMFLGKRNLFRAVLKSAVRRSARTIAPTRFVKEDILHRFGTDSNRVAVTLESADPISEKQQPIPNLVNKRFILYVGRAQHHKNLARLIRATESLSNQHPDLLLVLAGKKDAAYNALQTLCEQRGLKNIVFTDFVSEGELRWLYDNCQAYVFPSLSEGFGLPGLEAMLHEAPVISSNATCLPEVYGDAALYFNPYDTEDMALKIDRVLRDTQLQKKLITRGKTQLGKYSWRKMAEQTLDVYAKALGN